MKKYFAYKVVRRRANHLYSNIDASELRIEYKVDEWVTHKPERGLLCVFRHFKDARYFKSYNEDLEIWRCEVSRPSDFSRIAINFYFYPHIFDLIRKKRKYTHLCFTHDAMPRGTMFVDKVKLIEKVE